MDKIETVKAVIANRGRAVAGKAKEITEIAKLKAQIMSCEEIIRKNYLEIGKRVFEAYEEAENGECPDTALGEDNGSVKSTEDAEALDAACDARKTQKWEARYRKQCTAILNAKKGIEDLERRIEELKTKE